MMLSLAIRNVLRNRRRSAITISSIAIGLIAMIFLWGFTDGMNRARVLKTTPEIGRAKNRGGLKPIGGE